MRNCPLVETHGKLHLFDPAEFSGSRPTLAEFSDVLQAVVDNFMQFVELDPGDPGYEVTEDGVVLNRYVRQYDPRYFGDQADVLELQYINRRIGDLKIALVEGAMMWSEIMSGSDVSKEVEK